MTAHALAYRAARRAIRPKAPMTVSEWADANRMLSTEGSAEPGQWKTSRNPPMREIMDSLSVDSRLSKVVLMKPSQWGGTEIGSNFIAYIIDYAKGPAAIVMPTEASLQDWSAQKFDPMARDTKCVAEAMASRSNRAGDNAAKRKRFTGGLLYFKTAGSTSELKATTLRYALADEVDEWDWTTTQGDPLGLLDIRLTTFHDSKMFVVSSPTIKDASRIEEQFLLGDRRRYHVPCPHCDELQTLKWPNIRWHKTGARVSRAWYVCEHCGSEIEEFNKPAMLANGRWIAENPEARHRSYHINGIYTPIGLGLAWSDLAEEWIAAQDDIKDLVIFVNTRLAETWADRSHDIKPNLLAARAEPYDLRTIPQGCLVLTAGVDTQDDRLEVRIEGWGVGDKSWNIDYHVIPGKPNEDHVWRQLADYLNAEFINQFGKTLKIEATAIDTGGHHTHDVYAFVRAGLIRRPMAIKGASQPGRIILGKPSAQDVNRRGQTIKKGVMLYPVGTDTAKHLLYNRLNGDIDKDPSERKVHFSHQLEAAHFDGLVSETYNPRKNRWEVKKGKRNEPLDTWVYAQAAAHHPEIYLHKWKAADWKRRAAMVEPEHVQPSPTVNHESTPKPAPPPTKQRPRRRVVYNR